MANHKPPEHIVIRQPKVEDALGFIQLMEVLDSETEFLLYEPGERMVSETEQRKRFAAAKNSTQQHTLLAFDNDNQQVVGFCGGRRGSVARTKHVVHLVIALRQSHCNQGIGSALLAQLIQWAESNNIHRITLHVDVSNNSAIQLYKKFGFVIEGTERHAIKLNHGFCDQHVMGRIGFAKQ